MKHYVDMFKKPISKEDAVLAVRATLTMKRATTSLLTRRLRWGYAKAFNVMELLEDAGFVGPQRSDASRTILLKTDDAAVNAVLRQLKKGKK